MLYAIDNYEIGKQREVSASDIVQDKHCFRTGRFSCPECNETVTLVERVDTTAYFRHHNRSQASPECDKRVDGRSGLTLYERVGLPLYLKCNSESSFKLYFGFPSLGEVLFQRAFEDKVQIKISNGVSHGRTERLIPITRTNFYEDQTTLVPVDFIPPNGQNYSINYSESAVSSKLRAVWSDYADGFQNESAIFTYTESGGKKIRRGDCITTEKEYFLITRRPPPSYPEINNRIAGTMYLDNYLYNVYVIRINASTTNPSRFAGINNYLKSIFGVWLLEKSPELITLWPPVAENEGLVPVLQAAKIFCAAISGNDIPKVYTYNGASVSTAQVESDGSGNYSVALLFYGPQIIASVDRKYVGVESIYRKRLLTSSKNCYSLSVVDKEGNAMDFCLPLPTSVIEGGISLSLNAKAELYHKNRREQYKHISFRDAQTVSITDLNIHDNLDIYVESRKIFGISFKKPESSVDIFEDHVLAKGLLSSAKGTEVPIPGWVRQYVKLMIEHEYTEFTSVLKNMINCGNMHTGALRYLADIRGMV